MLTLDKVLSWKLDVNTTDVRSNIEKAAKAITAELIDLCQRNWEDITDPLLEGQVVTFLGFSLIPIIMIDESSLDSDTPNGQPGLLFANMDYDKVEEIIAKVDPSGGVPGGIDLGFIYQHNPLSRQLKQQINLALSRLSTILTQPASSNSQFDHLKKYTSLDILGWRIEMDADNRYAKVYVPFRKTFLYMTYGEDPGDHYVEQLKKDLQGFITANNLDVSIREVSFLSEDGDTPESRVYVYKYVVSGFIADLGELEELISSHETFSPRSESIALPWTPFEYFYG